MIECSYHRPLAGLPAGRAACDLLAELTKVADDGLCEVQPDACSECCKWYRPSPQHINPVVASLLYHLSWRIVNQGGVPGCSSDRAVQLYQLAAENIPTEDDSVSVAADVDGQSHIHCNALSRLLPRPLRRSGPAVTKWAVGVTTAPRDQITLEACLASLAIAGWDKPRLFVDGTVKLPASCLHLPASHREPQLGAWPSYYFALAELFHREPDAQAYMLVQDDMVLFKHPGLRTYLESVLWPGSTPGIVSLFCSAEYTHARAGWHELRESLVWGAGANVFSQRAAMGFLSHPHVIQHRLRPEMEGLANIDGLIGEWASTEKVPVFLPTPSLAQHIGHVSALWPRVRAFGNRRATWFAGDAKH